MSRLTREHILVSGPAPPRPSDSYETAQSSFCSRRVVERLSDGTVAEIPYRAAIDMAFGRENIEG